jgi:hypothetical protein
LEDSKAKLPVQLPLFGMTIHAQLLTR